MKKMQFYMTANFQQQVDPLIVFELIRLVNFLFNKYPYDMLVFEPSEKGYLRVRLAGYSFIDNMLDEETVIAETRIKLNNTFWWKVDDYGEFYVGTFLFPDDW
jgi:hypothetical protein